MNIAKREEDERERAFGKTCSSSHSLLSQFVYTLVLVLNVIAHATKVNRGIKKKRGSCGKVNSLSVFLGCVLVVRALGDCSLFLKKSCESAADQKNRDLQEYILPKSNANSHTNIYTNNDMQTIFLRPCYCCKAIGVIIVVDVLVVVHVAVYLVEHMDTNDFYLGFGYSEARAAAVFSALSDFNSTRSHFLSLLSFFLRLRFLSFSFYLFVSGAFRSAVACLHGFIIDSSFRC